MPWKLPVNNNQIWLYPSPTNTLVGIKIVTLNIIFKKLYNSKYEISARLNIKIDKLTRIRMQILRVSMKICRILI